MARFTKEALRALGIKSELDLKFASNKKVLIKLYDGTQKILENVTGIDQIENDMFLATTFYYVQDNKNCTFDTTNKNISEIIILD